VKIKGLFLIGLMAVMALAACATMGGREAMPLRAADRVPFGRIVALLQKAGAR